MRMLDLFCGRWGWSKAFAARGWECVGIDLTEPSEVPEGCYFVRANVLSICSSDMGFHCTLTADQWGEDLGYFDFICASSPCEQFSVHGMKHFHPNPPYPELGIKLFNHTRQMCESSGIPYVMENVRAAQKFVGNATQHCGPFYLWGTGVPAFMPKRIIKGMKLGGGKDFKNASPELRRLYRKMDPMTATSSKSPERLALTAAVATIPFELANCIAEGATRLLVAHA